MKVTDKELRDLKEIGNYFVEHDKTTFEHSAYRIIYELFTRLQEEQVREHIDSMVLDKIQYPDELVGMIAEEISGSGGACCDFIKVALSLMPKDLLKMTKEEYGFYD